MAKTNRSNRDRNGGVLDMARERPLAAAAAAASAAAAGLFLWSKRAQIGEQLNSLNDQFAEWKENWMASATDDSFGIDDDTASSARTSRRRPNASRPRTSRANGEQVEATPTA